MDKSWVSNPNSKSLVEALFLWLLTMYFRDEGKKTLFCLIYTLVLRNIHLELGSTVLTWIWWPKMYFYSYFGHDLLLLLPLICPCEPMVTMGKIKLPFPVHLPRFRENILPSTASKTRLCHHLLWAPQNGFFVSWKRFSFPGRHFFMISAKHQCVLIKFNKVYICQGRFNVDSGIVLWRFNYPSVKKTRTLLSTWVKKEC